MCPTQRRMTQQRRVLMEVLQDLGNHPTADELYAAVKKRLPGVSKGTVYRNLQVLTENRDVRTISTRTGIRHYDHDAHNHYHIHCTQCGRLADVSLKPLDITALSKSQVSGFEVTGHNIELSGVCPECSAKNERRR